MTDKPTITQDYHAATKAFDNVLGHAAGYAEYGGMSDREAGIRSLTQDLAKHRESSVAELQAEVERMRKVLGMAANQFRYYEQNHRLKGTSNGAAKAETNKRCAEQCEAALAPKEPVE